MQRNSLLFTYQNIADSPATVLNTVDETVAAIAAICRQYGASAWLFGSQAKGTSHLGSDIDIAVRGEAFDAVEESVDALDTVFVVDLVDLRHPYKKGIEDAWINIA